MKSSSPRWQTVSLRRSYGCISSRRWSLCSILTRTATDQGARRCKRWESVENDVGEQAG
jgi:hypothetical protein